MNYKQLLINEIDDTQEMAKTDFFFFAHKILGYDKLTDVHEKWCKELQDLSNKRRLDLEPRGTYKSTVRTVAYTLWRLINNVNLRILIVNANYADANSFLREITGHMRKNKKFKYLFGDWVGSEKWTQSGIIIKPRTSVQKDMSIACAGTNSNITGKHYDIIICDDIVNQNDRDFNRFRERKKLFFEELLSVLEPNGWLFLIGTRWHFSDLYSHIINTINPSLEAKKLPTYRVNIQSAIDSSGNATFPDILPLSKLEQLKSEKGMQFNSQYLNNPLPETSQLFPESKIEWYLNPPKDLIYYAFMDPAVGESKSACRTALVVIGKSKKDGILYVVDVYADRIDPSNAIEVLFKYHKKWNFSKVGYESNFHQTYWYKLLSKLNAERNIYMSLVDIKQKLPKDVRIEGLEPLIANGTLRFYRDYTSIPMYKELIGEMLYYPRGQTVDCIDALESCVRIAKGISTPIEPNIEVSGERIKWI